MPNIRTPDERFAALPDFPFSPRYIDINGLRVHYVDEGAGRTVLCLHGEPTWSYLYRKVIPILARSSCRVIALDFVGFGRSDKLTEHEEYSFRLHQETVARFIRALDLEGITLIGHDGGAVFGLCVVAGEPDRFSRLVIMNTDLPTGSQPTNTMFETWKKFVTIEPDLPIALVIRSALAHGYKIPDDVVAAYEAPYPDETFKAGAATWPLLVPIRPDDPGAAEVRAARDALSTWTKPALLMFSDEDPIYAGASKQYRQAMPKLTNEMDIVIQNAGHFLLEEKGEEAARHILDFIDRTPDQP